MSERYSAYKEHLTEGPRNLRRKPVRTALAAFTIIFGLTAGAEAIESAFGSDAHATASDTHAARRHEKRFSVRIKNIQTTLHKLGFYRPKPDGYDGPVTRAAIEYFQIDHDMKADGIYGPKTAKAARAELARKGRKADDEKSGVVEAFEDLGKDAGTVAGTAIAAPFKALSDLVK